MIEVKDLEVVRKVGREVTREDNPKSAVDESNEDIPQTDSVSKFTIISYFSYFPYPNLKVNLE